jgi:hypothetical protein
LERKARPDNVALKVLKVLKVLRVCKAHQVLLAWAGLPAPRARPVRPAWRAQRVVKA